MTGNTKSCGCLHKDSARVTGERVRKLNQYDLTGEFGVGWTHNAHSEFYFDLEDYSVINKYHWMNQNGYIVAKVWEDNHPHSLNLHRLIMQEHGYDIENLDIDHINHLTYDNRKVNLRPCEHHKNIAASKTYTNNTSGRKGVVWDKSRNKWSAAITINKKTHHLGRYDRFEDAVAARESGEQRYHQEFHFDDSINYDTTNQQI